MASVGWNVPYLFYDWAFKRGGYFLVNGMVEGMMNITAEPKFFFVPTASLFFSSAYLLARSGVLSPTAMQCAQNITKIFIEPDAEFDSPPFDAWIVDGKWGFWWIVFSAAVNYALDDSWNNIFKILSISAAIIGGYLVAQHLVWRGFRASWLESIEAIRIYYLQHRVEFNFYYAQGGYSYRNCPDSGICFMPVVVVENKSPSRFSELLSSYYNGLDWPAEVCE